jgi:hypothetical protein
LRCKRCEYRPQWNQLFTVARWNQGIGQVEVFRPGKAGPPQNDPALNVHSDVEPTEVFLRAGSTGVSHISDHAQNVAGIMISKHSGSLAGVAKDAKLYSSAFVDEGPGGEQALVANNHIARRNGQDVRAINHSYGLNLGGDADGNSYFTKGLDWSASTHEVLHVVAGGQGNDVPQPADNYNGMTVAYSDIVDGKYSRVHAGNVVEGNLTQDRTFISLLAPGDKFPMTNTNSMSTTAPHPDGTSFAAPHVTGTVALIQQMGDDRILHPLGPQWKDDNWKKHEVVKAVLMNSADKLSGVHGSSRTVTSNDATNNYTWESSLAYLNTNQPLDIQFGAGHLNAHKALVQLNAGEWDAGSDIPLIGWDWGETGGPGTTLSYPFEDTLTGDQWIGITLAWDRVVNSTGTNGNYNTFDMYTIPGPAEDNGVNNLELYLLPEGWTDLSQAGNAASIATHQNLEHIFVKVPATGNYEIVVKQVTGGPDTDVDFGLAWWYGNPFIPILLPGDFDLDNDVDGRDFIVWQRNPSIGNLSDWQANYGTSGLTAANTAVPEPSMMMLLSALLALSLAKIRTANGR